MISCEDVLSDDESDSQFMSEAQKYVDSDKADSDLETELYSQIHFAEDLNATASTESFGTGNSYVFDVTPVKSCDSLYFKPETEFPCDVKQGTSKTMKENHFESSTPKISVKNNLLSGKKKKIINNKIKLQKVKTAKAKVAVGSGLKPSKSSEDSGCFESATCSDNHDANDTDDSVIILDLSDVVTNVETKEVILIDSSPTSDDVSFGRNSSSSTPSDSDDSLKFSLSLPSSGPNTSGDLWHIDHEDRFSFIRKQKRYHEKRSSFCNNCKKKGHLSKDCMEPRNTKCYICGRDHVWSMCHQRMCGRCLEYGHTTKKCRYKACELTCNLCKMRGHTVNDCPDLWRRYHLTTSPDSIIKGSKEISQGVKKYCYNCGHEGHYGHECLRPRMSPDSFPAWPFVISYKDPSRQLKKHSRKSSIGESSNSSRHYDSYSRHKHNKKHRSRADEIRAEIPQVYLENSKKSRNKEKKKFRDGKHSPLIRGSDFPGSSSVIVLDEEGHKNKKKRKRDFDKLYAFKRKKQKLNVTL